MEGFINFGQAILTLLKYGGGVSAAIAFSVGAYFKMWGGQNGSEKAKIWWIGAVIGLLVLLGSSSISDWLQSKMIF